MPYNIPTLPQQQSAPQGEIVLYQPNESIRLEVRLEDDTVWLTTSQMAELFNREESNIRRHIINVFKERELERENNVQNIHVNGVKKPVPCYTLDVIISVGYRVKSQRGTQFRQWANKILKDYLLKGYAVNAHIMNLQQKVTEQGEQLKELQGKVDFFVRTSLPPVEGIFYDGQIFDAYKQIVSLIKQAKKTIVLIDNYIDESTLTMLSQRGDGVSAVIYSRPLTQQQQLTVNRYNQQYAPVTVNICQQNHDRFLIVDGEVYLFGASFKDAGKKLFAYIRMQETSEEELLSGIR